MKRATKTSTTNTSSVGKRSPATRTAKRQPCSEWYTCDRWSGLRAKVVTLVTTPPTKTSDGTLRDMVSDWYTRTLEAHSQIRLAHAGMAEAIQSTTPTPEEAAAAFAAWELLDAAAKNLNTLFSELDETHSNSALFAGGAR